MSWFGRQPVRRKLLLIVMAVTASALLLSAAGFLVWDTLRFRASMLEDLETQAAIAAESASAALVFEVDEQAGTTLAALQSRRTIDNAAVYDLNGRRVAEWVRPGSARRIPAEAHGWDGSFTLSNAEVLRPVTALDGTPVGSIFVSSELDEMWARFRAQALSLAAMFLVAVGAAFLLSMRLQRTVSGPLADLSRTASEISSRGDYSLRVPPGHRDELGAVVATFNAMLDRIEHRERELQEANDTLQEANRLKDEFLATLSHELRTPLNAVLGWSRLLVSDSVSPGSQARALSAIERNATIQARLIDDLLDISRVMRGKLRLEVEPLDLRAIADAAIEIVRPGAAAKQIAIDLDVAPGSGLVTGDPQRLQQVLWNLLANSLKFTPAHGRITVRLWSEGPEELIEVADTGAGIDPAFLPHVFDLFRQADASTTREYGGLGLGLAIVRKLVELHGGTVTAASDGRGRGTTVTVRLPRRAKAGTAPRRDGAAMPVPRPATSAEGLRVLVVEDEADSRELVEALLVERGADVRSVESAPAAMAALESFTPDVLLSDIAMTGEDGYSLLARVRALPPPAGDVPAIALTAYAGEVDRQRALDAGFQGFVAKPFDPSALVDAVVALAGSRT
jgi:signal transduction histidine kinase/ActR/RegA family two-component response regulator